MVSRHLSSVVQSALNTDDSSFLRSSEICKEMRLCFHDILWSKKKIFPRVFNFEDWRFSVARGILV